MKNILIIILMICATTVACNKIKIESPDDFNVTVLNASVVANKKIEFTMKGNPDDITFYSGELDRNYDLRDVSTKETSGNPEFEFTSNVQFGPVGLNNLSILVSNDFSGQYDSANVTLANWEDVTSRAILGSNATNISSGIINLNDLKVEDKPIYIAFRYVSSQPLTLKQRQWTIASFQFRTKFDDGKIFTNAASFTDVGFAPVNLVGDSARWVSSASLSHVGLDAGYPADDDWVISKPFDLNTVTPDNKGARNIKAVFQPPIRTYSYTYTTPGVYQATFVATNQKDGVKKQTVRRVEIKVAL